MHQTADTNESKEDHILINMIQTSNDAQTIHKSMSDGEDTGMLSSKSPKYKSHISKRQKYNRTTSETNVEIFG